jgi:Zn-dependent M28 family amino/carboxypeptidase
VVAGPALAALGALLGSRRLRRTGGALACGSMAAMADIAARAAVPGANDNLAAVAVLVELARLLRDDPPDGVRVLLLSTGSEESSMEGMRGFVARHAADLARERTRFVVLECIGGPEAIVLEGEGMLRMHDYTPAVRDWLAACGERTGHRLRRRLRSGFATDALISLKAGYPTGVLAAIDEYKMAPNYHSRRDVAANLDFGTVAACTAVCLEAVRSLSRPRRAPAPA